MIKQRTDELYLSSSENYLLMIGITNVKVYNLNNDSLYKLKIRDISQAIITYDDKYIICRKEYSNYLYIYNLEDGKILLRKKISAEYKISSLVQCDTENIFLSLKSDYTKNSLTCIIIRYNFETGEEQKIVLPHLIEADFKSYIKKGNLLLFPFEFFCEDKYQTVYYTWNDCFVKTDDKLVRECHLNMDMNYSKNADYYSIATIGDFEENNYSKFTNDSQIVVYNKYNQPIIKINNRIFLTPEDIAKKYYLGYFTYDIDADEDVFYTKYDNIVELYYLKSMTLKKIEFDFDIMNVYISFKNDCIILLSLEIYCSYSYIYKLSNMIKNEIAYIL